MRLENSGLVLMSRILQGGLLFAEGVPVLCIQRRGAEQRPMLCVSAGCSKPQRAVQTCMQ